MTFGTDKPPSLSQLFEAPEDHVGVFGWLCGYSADELFLNAAAERFTRQTHRQRATAGDVSLVAMLDPGQPRLSTVQVPGVLHNPLPVRQGLMHAKVALLGFRAVARTEAWCVRLIVSTGNWTRQTLEESLDLAWTVDLVNGDNGDDTPQRAADIAAAAGFMRHLRNLGQGSPLGATSSISQEARELLDTWTAQIEESVPPDTVPRFIDNRKKSLFGQITERVGSRKRNHLSIGSGFYEAGDSAARPETLRRILEKLRGNLTGNPEIDLYVEPDDCQAIAAAVEAIRDDGIIIRRAASPTGPQRRLHAKFIFSANFRDNSEHCLNAWLYLGSGNMTKSGMMLADGKGGNLEAGIVVTPDNLVWDEKGGVPVCSLLPLDWDEGSEVSPEDCASGGGMPDRPTAYSAPPVSHLVWRGHDDGTGHLKICREDGVNLNFDAFDPSGAACARDGDFFIWQSERPLEVRLAWRQEKQTLEEFVPVIDEYGRISAQELSPVRIDEVWPQLADFPLPPPVEELDGDEDDSPGGIVDGRGSSPASPIGSYPIRRMMELVERIAERQCALTPIDWTAWCARLGQTLEQAKDDEVVRHFHKLGLDPLAALRAAPFRPDFALDGSKEAELYEQTLDRVGKAWGTAALKPLGE